MLHQADAEFIAGLKKIAGDGNVLSDSALIEDYGHDEFALRDIGRLPVAVVKPAGTSEVAAILKMADSARVPVTPRGGGTGLCGGCVPSEGGIVLSLERMKSIEIDAPNLLAMAGAGATLGELDAAVEAAELYFPPHPGDESAMIGGLVATNAGGSRAVKYGGIRNAIRGLEVVLPNGEIIHPGGRILKSSTGYNLMHLFIGSEGTLGVVTSAVIQLVTRPPRLRTLVVPFADLESAIDTVPLLLKGSFVPVALEFLGLDVITITEEHLHKRWPSHEGAAHLLVILDAATDEEQDRLSQEAAEICLAGGGIDVYIADTPKKQDEVLGIRSKIYEAIKSETIEILDISVPRAEIAGHVRKVSEVSDRYGLWLPTFGHAADGNVHTHIMKARYVDGRIVPLPESEWRDKIDEVRAELYRDGVGRGGVISGEHGIGLVKKPFLSMSLEEGQIALMKEIKRVFDPRGILNPGKIFD